MSICDDGYVLKKKLYFFLLGKKYILDQKNPKPKGNNEESIEGTQV